MKIVQIIPANAGWYAALSGDEARPVAVWALVEMTPEEAEKRESPGPGLPIVCATAGRCQAVIGLTCYFSSLEDAEQMEGFHSYSYKSPTPWPRPSAGEVKPPTNRQQTDDVFDVAIRELEDEELLKIEEQEEDEEE